MVESPPAAPPAAAPPPPPDGRARRRRRLAILLAAGLSGLVLRSTWHEVRRGEPNEPSLDALLAPFARAVAGRGPVGVLLEPGHPEEAIGITNKLRYALAPIDVSEGDEGRRFVAVWAATDEGRARLVAGRRLAEVARVAGGYVLYERTGP